MERLHQSRSRRNALAGYGLFSVKPFYVSRVTAIVQRGRVTSNTRILLNLMLGNMSKSLTQSCQGHYCIKSVAKYPCASSACTHTNVHTTEYQKKQCFFFFVWTMSVRGGERRGGVDEPPAIFCCRRIFALRASALFSCRTRYCSRPAKVLESTCSRRLYCQKCP